MFVIELIKDFKILSNLKEIDITLLITLKPVNVQVLFSKG